MHNENAKKFDNLNISTFLDSFDPFLREII